MCREQSAIVQLPPFMRRRSAASRLCGLLLGALCLAPPVVALPAAPSASPGFAETVAERAVVQARINPKPIELPVVDADGRPVGLIDITDLIGLALIEAPPADAEAQVA